MPMAPMTAEEDNYWGEHPRFELADWRYEVANGNTRLGYKEWVLAKMREEQFEKHGEKIKT